ncbi:MAG: DUF3108 domain-containing protein, partial [Burkholderiaceae bacterium]|nr:DUF3108 domain-containing protein [Burkholderiaceae bacterium]
MPRSALFVITALVLVLHWIVLQGVPLAWEMPVPAAANAVFSTRSIAVAARVAAPAPAPAPPAKAAAPVTKAKPAAPKSTGHRAPAPQQTTQRDVLPAAAQTALDHGAASAVDDQAADANSTTEAVATTDAAPEPPRPEPAANAEVPAASVEAPPTPSQPVAETTAEPPTTAGIEISTPAGQQAAAGNPASIDTGMGAAAATPSPSASTQSPAPVRLPPPTRLVFDVSGQAKKFDYSAKAELLWQHDGSRYEAQQEISAFLVGSRRQRSVGKITVQGLQPERFSDRSRSEQAAHFDFDQGRVTFSANTPATAIGPGAQDRLSVFIQLGALLAAQPERFVRGTHITLTTAGARSADRWTFTIEGAETLDLPVGPTHVIKLLRLPRKDYDQKAELWVA